jgi:hypothetical protein
MRQPLLALGGARRCLGQPSDSSHFHNENQSHYHLGVASADRACNTARAFGPELARRAADSRRTAIFVDAPGCFDVMDNR